MKKYLFAFVILTIACWEHASAVNNEYVKAMEENISKLENAKTPEELMQITNAFERIANNETDKWLPPYYAAYGYIILNYMEKSKDQKDLYLDKADILAKKAEEINDNKDEVELILLRAYIVQSRSNVNPASRATEMQPKAEKLLKKANEIDPENPRYYFLTGQNLFYTPKMFGGGKKKAKPVLEIAVEKYNSYKLSSPIHPSWDRKTAEMLLSKCK